MQEGCKSLRRTAGSAKKYSSLQSDPQKNTLPYSPLPENLIPLQVNALFTYGYKSPNNTKFYEFLSDWPAAIVIVSYAFFCGLLVARLWHLTYLGDNFDSERITQLATDQNANLAN